MNLRTMRRASPSPKRRSWLTAAITVIAICSGVATTGYAQDSGLDLANQPLFASDNVPPNIMVAVDDSGSMDFETLFPTDSGLLYWDTGLKSTWTGSGFVQAGGIPYAYLFPNGNNNCNNSACEARDRRVYADANGYYALPPVPALAFARSPQFNSAYFNPDPDVEYAPWVTGQFNDVDPENAPSDPTNGNTRFDLTNKIRVYADGYNFAAPTGLLFGNVTYADGRGPCVRYQSYTLFGKTYQICVQHGDNWHTSASDYVMARDQIVGIEYFPATFYLKASTPPAPEFGWKASAPTIPGRSPDGTQNLVGYEIKPANFTSTAKYKDAIQKFANWFTYYRKRHLATRGGITAAFADVSRGRVGTCTINGAQQNFNGTLEIRDLSQRDDRSDFYSSVFNIDFSRAKGTPNRVALQYLGNRLEKQSGLITSPCQQNFAILFTDGYNTTQPQNAVGNVDGNSEAAGRYGKPFTDGNSNTIADVAMRYYENLKPADPDIDLNRVPVADGCKVTPPERPNPALDCERDPHMVTFGVTLDQRGSIFGKDDAVNTDPYANWPAALDWPDPTTGNYGLEQIDDLWHATINSHGALLNASTPADLADQFSAALREITERSGSANAVAANSGSLTADSIIYQATFTSGAWNGDLTAYKIDPGSKGKTKLWSAAEALDKRIEPRSIITSIEGNQAQDQNNSYAAQLFTYTNVVNSEHSTLTADEVAFLRGDRSKEEDEKDGIFRNRRANILGDIVHSTPLYVGEPSRLRYPQAGEWKDLLHPGAPAPENTVQSYSAPGTSRGFAQQNADRLPMIYVGANDGMLHGFDASDDKNKGKQGKGKGGEERIAFVPNGVLSQLGRLTKPNYAHRYYVDESPVEGDVVYDGAWHSVLVSGLGNGGRSVFALDITDPDNFESNPKQAFLWEFTDSGLGYTHGRPSVVRLHNGQWAAMVANGYNSDEQRASLYLLDIKTGSVIAKIDTAAPDGSPNGLAEPFPVDLDGDSITDYAYAGDLQGNIWKFDLTSTNPGAWHATRLFTAKAPNGKVQPITTQPQVGIHPYGRDYGVMVYFGTGKYLETTDAIIDTDKRNSFYGIWDLDVFTFNNARGENQPVFTTPLKQNIPRSRLVKQDVLTDTPAGDNYRGVTNNPVNYEQADKNKQGDGGARGWVLDLPEGIGERIVSNPRIQGSTVAFSTLLPSAKSCQPVNSGFFMLIDSATGGRTGFPAFDLNGDRQFTRDEDTVAVGDDDHASVSGVAVSQGSPGAATFLVDRDNDSDQVNLSASDGSTVQIDVNIGRKPDGRRSWREIRR